MAGHPCLALKIQRMQGLLCATQVHGISATIQYKGARFACYTLHIGYRELFYFFLSVPVPNK